MPHHDSDDADEPINPALEAVGLIDIHCHLLPGIDDGCKDASESLECARRLAEAGFTHVFCTPHVSPDYPQSSPTMIPTAVTELQRAVDEAGIGVKLFAGGEFRLGPQMAEAARTELLMMNQGNSRGGRFILFDVRENDWPEHFDKSMVRFAQQGITPIMAHPERSAFVCEDPLNAADHLSELGVLLQLNSYVLGDEKSMSRRMFSKAMRQAAERLLEFDYYSFIASDLHGAEMLDDCIASMAAAREQIGSAAFRRLAKRNPLQLLPH